MALLSSDSTKRLCIATGSAAAGNELASAVNNASALASLMTQGAAAMIVATDTSQTIDFAALKVGDTVLHVPAVAGNSDFSTVVNAPATGTVLYNNSTVDGAQTVVVGGNTVSFTANATAPATGTVVYDPSTVTGAQTVVVGGHTASFTAVDNDDHATVLAAITAINLVATITALVTPSESPSGTLLLTAVTSGYGGNAITLAVTGTGASRSGANLTGGTDSAHGTVLAALTAIALVPAVVALVTASESPSGTLLLTAKANGAAGNAITLAVTGTGATRSGATLAGGLEAGMLPAAAVIGDLYAVLRAYANAADSAAIF